MRELAIASLEELGHYSADMRKLPVVDDGAKSRVGRCNDGHEISFLVQLCVCSRCEEG
jgi:hypothetical protein